MNSGLLDVDKPSTWLLTIAFAVVISFASRALQRATGRSGKPPWNRAAWGYFGVLVVGILVTLTWFAQPFGPRTNPFFAGIVAGIWALVAQAFFGRPTK